MLPQPDLVAELVHERSRSCLATARLPGRLRHVLAVAFRRAADRLEPRPARLAPNP